MTKRMRALSAMTLATLVASSQPSLWARAAHADEGVAPSMHRAPMAPPIAPELVPAELCMPPEPGDEEPDDAEDPGDVEGVDADAEGVDKDGDGVPDVPPAPVDLGPDPEAEVHDVVDSPENEELRYTADLSDDDLKAMWEREPESLGSMSIGFSDSGRLINGVPFPRHPDWIIVDPTDTWATQETVSFLTAAIHEVKARLPDSPPLRVNDISRKDGGWLRPHRSHQNGRDVDLGFYYPTVDPIRIKAREKCIDLMRNWALVRALITNGDVQVILVDKRVQAVLYSYALSIGEDKEWLDSIFKGGPTALIQHARRHRDHFHVRYYNARAQELGRRVQPLLALRPEQNVTTHKVKRGDNLGAIARRYGSTVVGLKKRNGLRGNALRVGQVLTVPMRGPCTNCPQPPSVVVPPRRLPPVDERALAAVGGLVTSENAPPGAADTDAPSSGPRAPQLVPAEMADSAIDALPVDDAGHPVAPAPTGDEGGDEAGATTTKTPAGAPAATKKSTTAPTKKAPNKTPKKSTKKSAKKSTKKTPKKSAKKSTAAPSKKPAATTTKK